MANSANDLIECESASVRLTSGNLFKFPIVNNKDVYRHFYKTDDEFEYQLQCLFLENDTYALYGKKENLAYLICAWNKKEEINDAALEVIKSSDKFSYLLN